MYFIMYIGQYFCTEGKNKTKQKITNFNNLINISYTLLIDNTHMQIKFWKGVWKNAYQLSKQKIFNALTMTLLNNVDRNHFFEFFYIT